MSVADHPDPGECAVSARATRRGTCHYCGAEGLVSSDHVIAVSLGGTGVVDACVPCNSQKGNQFPTCLCEECTAIVREWISREVRRRCYSRMTRRSRKGLARMLMRYVLGDETWYVRQWRWWVSSEGEEMLTMFLSHAGDDVLRWNIDTGVVQRMTREVDDGQWEMAIAEGRPTMPEPPPRIVWADLEDESANSLP